MSEKFNSDCGAVQLIAPSLVKDFMAKGHKVIVTISVRGVQLRPPLC